MTAEREFKYDIAFSFLARDLGLARDLADGLAPLRVFLFIREQEDIAGTNGIETFSRVFKEEARLNVVLLREGWGETPWTRVEATAIQERALRDGWPTIFVVKLDKAKAPVWIPQQHLYLDFEEFGREQAVGAIRARALEVGAPSRRETAEELHGRLARRAAQEMDNQRRWHNDEGVKLAYAEVHDLFDAIKRAVDRICAVDSQAKAECGYKGDMLVVRCNGRSMSVARIFRYGNSLNEARLYAVRYQGWVALPTESHSSIGTYKVDDQSIVPVFSENGSLCWRVDHPPGGLSTAALADHLLKSFLEFAYAPTVDNPRKGGASFRR